MSDSADELRPDHPPSVALGRKSPLREKFAKSSAIAGQAFVFIRRSRAASRFKSLFPTIPTLLSVAFGFGLKAWWDESQAEKLQHTEIQREIRSVTFELGYNLDICS